MGDGGSHSQMFARSTHVMLPAPRPKKKNFRPPAAASQGSCLQRNMLRVLSFRLFFLLSEKAILRTEMKCACAPAVCRHACSGDVRKVFYILVVGTWPACPKRPATYWNPGSIHVGCRQLVRAPKQPTTSVHRDHPSMKNPVAFGTAYRAAAATALSGESLVTAVWKECAAARATMTATSARFSFWRSRVPIVARAPGVKEGLACNVNAQMLEPWTLEPWITYT